MTGDTNVRYLIIAQGQNEFVDLKGGRKPESREGECFPRLCGRGRTECQETRSFAKSATDVSSPLSPCFERRFHPCAC